MLRSPAALEPMRMEPEMVEQLDKAVASACELMVAVACEQTEAVWAGRELASTQIKL